MERSLKLITINSNQAYGEFRKLIVEYADELGVDLCFQKFDEELDNLEFHYGAPNGCSALLIDEKGEAVGCVGVRKFESDCAELKRMYLRKSYRGGGNGRKLLEFSIDNAKKMGYHKLRLDTLKTLETAIGLYKKYGFKEIKPYRFNPFDNVVYMELNLLV